MKLVFVSSLFLFSLSSFAGSLRCVSNPSDQQQITVQGTISQGNILAVNGVNRNENESVEILVNQIKPSNDFVEIQGVARNRLFIGGGHMKVQLILPFKEAALATLRTITPVFNQGLHIQEMQLSCKVQNLYQIPPNKPVLARM